VLYINRYEYRSADVLLRDFELMKNNAIKFNEQSSPIAQEAIAIYELVKDKIESQRAELKELEAAVDDQMGGKPKKKKKGGPTSTKSSASVTSAGNMASLGEDLRQNSMPLEGGETDSDESFSNLLDD